MKSQNSRNLSHENNLRSTTYNPVSRNKFFANSLTINYQKPIKFQKLLKLPIDTTQNFFYDTMRINSKYNLSTKSAKNNTKRYKNNYTTMTPTNHLNMLEIPENNNSPSKFTQKMNVRKFKLKNALRAKSNIQKLHRENATFFTNNLLENTYPTYLSNKPIKIRPNKLSNRISPNLLAKNSNIQKFPIELCENLSKSTRNHFNKKSLNITLPIQAYKTNTPTPKSIRIRRKFTKKQHKNIELQNTFRGSEAENQAAKRLEKEEEILMQIRKNKLFSKMSDCVKPLFFFDLDKKTSKLEQEKVVTPNFVATPRNEKNFAKNQNCAEDDQIEDDVPKKCIIDTKFIMEEINKKMGMFKANIYVNKTKIVNNIINGKQNQPHKLPKIPKDLIPKNSHQIPPDNFIPL